MQFPNSKATQTKKHHKYLTYNFIWGNSQLQRVLLGESWEKVTNKARRTSENPSETNFRNLLQRSNYENYLYTVNQFSHKKRKKTLNPQRKWKNTKRNERGGLLVASHGSSECHETIVPSALPPKRTRSQLPGDHFNRLAFTKKSRMMGFSSPVELPGYSPRANNSQYIKKKKEIPVSLADFWTVARLSKLRGDRCKGDLPKPSRRPVLCHKIVFMVVAMLVLGVFSCTYKRGLVLGVFLGLHPVL